jgi:2-polyprenyl-3-methyl-5-hydroxy-6-metoxy-1,4-benzoquinol methylase
MQLQLFTAKHLTKRLFALFGLQVSRAAKFPAVGGAKYFNTGMLTPLQENSRDLYDRFYSDQQALDEYYKGYRLEFYEEVSGHIRGSGVIVDGTNVLDVGCGTGHLLRQLAKWSRPKQMSGCDFSGEAIKYSRNRFDDIHFFQHDIYAPLPAKFDTILCTEVLEHLERPFMALQNLAQAVRPTGTLVLTVPNGRLDTSNEHLNFWSPESWKAFLERECPDAMISVAMLMSGRVNLGILRFGRS